MLFKAEGIRPRGSHNHRPEHWEYGSSTIVKPLSNSIVFPTGTRQPAYIDSPKDEEQGSLQPVMIILITA